MTKRPTPTHVATNLDANRSLHVTRLSVNGKPLELQMGSKDVNLTAKSSIVAAAYQSCQAKEISTRRLELSSIQPSSRHTLAQLSHMVTGLPLGLVLFFLRGGAQSTVLPSRRGLTVLPPGFFGRRRLQARLAARHAPALVLFCLFPHRQTIPWRARAACPTYTFHDKKQTKPTEPPSLHEKMFSPTCF